MPRVTSFSWKDCGGASDPVHIESVAVSPDPIKFPGKILLFMNTNKISFSFLSKKNRQSYNQHKIHHYRRTSH